METMSTFDLLMGMDAKDKAVPTKKVDVKRLSKELGAKFVVARAERDGQERFLLRNGADRVVYPEKQIAKWAAIRYSSDHITDYIELTDGYSIFEIGVPAHWDDMKIGELNVRRKWKLNILGVREGKMNMDVTNETVLHAGQQMLVLGRYEDLRRIFFRQ